MKNKGGDQVLLDGGKATMSGQTEAKVEAPTAIPIGWQLHCKE